MTEQTPLFGFDSGFLRKLEHIALLSRRPLPGATSGPRRSPRHGSSPEFADFREYTPGDDVRRVDWSAYARLDRLFLRLYSAEEIATLTLFLDHSRSMEFGTPEKSVTAARLAAIFAYVALFGHDHVAAVGFGASADSYLPPQVGTQSVPRVWRFIERTMSQVGGTTNFRAFGRDSQLRRGGLSIVVSDFLTESDWRSGLLALLARGQEVTAVQVLAREELDPDLRGDWELEDVETRTTVEVTGTTRLMREYHTRLSQHLEALRDFCRTHGIGYVLVPSDENLEESLLSRLQAARVVT